MIRTLVQTLVFLGGQAALLFGPAGTWDWPMAWAFLAVQVSMAAVVLWWGDPKMVRGRGGWEPNARQWDVALMAVAAPLFWAVPLAVSGLDYGRFHWTPPMPGWLVGLAAVLHVLGMALGVWAMTANKFFTKWVAVQTERGHHPVSEGPYAYVRHPGYAGAIVGFGAMPVMLGSLWALLPTLLGLALLVIRTYWEDRTLRRELTGYTEYARHVRWRLLPGVF